jgi:hypothetical protein
LKKLAAALAFFACAGARAALPDEIQVYIDDLEKKGERGVEVHVNTTPSGRSAPAYPGEVTPYHGLRVTPEISWGLGHDMDWGLYLPFSRTADGTVYFAGPKFRLKWMPLLPAEKGTGAFAGVNGEIAFVDERFEQPRRVGEIRPIVGYRGSEWLLAFNPILELDFAGEEKGKPVFAPAAKVSRNISRKLALGAEYYAVLGKLSQLAPRAEQEHVLFLVLDTEWLNFGVGRGVSGTAADRWTVKAIFSF